MRRFLPTAVIVVAALGLAGCADDPSVGPRSSVYHPVGEGRIATAPAPDPAPPDPSAILAPEPLVPDRDPRVASTPPPIDPGTSGPVVAAKPLDPARHVVPPLRLPASPAPPADPRAVGPSLPPGAMAAGTSDADPYFKSFLGAEPPELPREGTWFNTGAVQSLAGLRGQVVLLYFSFLKCGACPLMRPYLHHWHEAYGSKGLSIVYVDNGRADLLPEVKESVALQGMRYPVFYDADAKAVAACGIRAFPTAYLIGKDGKVLWEGNPVGIENQVEEAIVRALP